MLTRWNPFPNGTSRVLANPDVETFFREADNLLRSAFTSDAAIPRAADSHLTNIPLADWVDAENALSISIDLPGHDAKSVQVNVEGDTLTVKSERRHEKPAIK